ncbi:MAG: Eco57I restriction-modification methylase domain-containing protein, partial [Nanoarchaeota archaeon]|nr:Eco57I restriction-modification methylase domain-containing protein [Nanoarchaeota archaeon]
GKKIKPFFLWNLYFSEVFHNKGGFDVVIANPPYITIGGKQDYYIKEREKKYYIRHFKSYDYKTNYFALFIEKSISVSASDGIVTYIVPRTMLDNYHMQKLRQEVLDTTRILLLLELKYKVFEQAETGGNLVFIAQKNDSHRQREQNVVRASVANIFVKFGDFPFEPIVQSTFRTISQNNFLLLNQSYLSLLRKIESKSTFLGKLTEISNGVNTGNAAPILLSKKQQNSMYRKILEGKDICRYSLTWNGLWINYDRTLKNRIDLSKLITRQKKSIFHYGMKKYLMIRK